MECEIDGCHKLIHALGLCRRHYDLVRRYKLDRYNLRDLENTVLCDACGQPSDSLVVDHNHNHNHPDGETCPDCVRGFLCRECNLILGMAEDDPVKLEKLAEYARRRA